MVKKISVILLFISLHFITPSHAVDMADIEIHGFISQGFLYSDNNNYLTAETEDGTFQFNELGISFSKDLTDRLRIGLQLFSRDMGRVDNNEVVVDWAYGDYRWKDWLGFRAGIIRQVYGLYNETRDLDMFRTSVLLPQSIYYEVSRDFYARLAGGSVYGEIPIGAAGSLSYNLLTGTKNVDADSGFSKWVEAPGFLEVDEWEFGAFYNGSVQWQTPLEGLRFMVSGVKCTDMQALGHTTRQLGFLPAGTAMTTDIDMYSWVASAEYTWENLVIAAEYTLGKIDPDTGAGQKPEGFYLSGSYRLTDYFELGAYYSVSYYDKNDRDGEKLAARGLDDFRAWQKDFTLSTRFDINDYWLVKLEGHFINGAMEALPQDNPGGLEKDWFLFAAKTTFSF